MLSPGQFVLCLAGLCGLLYLLYVICQQGFTHRAEFFEPQQRQLGRDGDTPNGVEPMEYDVQRALDFSDCTVSARQRDETQQLRLQAEQIQTVDERFQAAKRKLEEHGLRPGVLPQKRRRELVEALNRRPACGRRTRSWRTEFSDNIRGDVIPKNMTNSLGIMRTGRTDPSIDLHPGALGPLSGLSGRWVSEESLPENLLEEMED